MNNELRRNIVQMVYEAKCGHIPSAFSIIDILEILYRKVLKYSINDIHSKDRDYFILSKGHGCLALYVVLEKFGFVGKKELTSFSKHDSLLGEHPDCLKVPGIEASTGSLGHGLPFAVGIALGLKINKMPNKVIVLIGDGECNEGSIWEAAMAAPKYNLDNLIVIVDKNNFQQTGSNSDIMDLRDLKNKWNSFGWEAEDIDGHNIEKLISYFDNLKNNQMPKALIANTIKGKGFSFSENNNDWHHSVLTKSFFEKALNELNKK